MILQKDACLYQHLRLWPMFAIVIRHSACLSDNIDVVTLLELFVQMQWLQQQQQRR